MMPITTELTLKPKFLYPPEPLLRVQQRVPVTPDGYIPIRVYGAAFEIVQPTLEKVGQVAVSLSLDKPFGFMKLQEGVPVMSQPTENIVLSPSNADPCQWIAAVATKEPLTDLDARLFDSGLELYARYAGVARL